jgi:hypothetical protein
MSSTARLTRVVLLLVAALGCFGREFLYRLIKQLASE